MEQPAELRISGKSLGLVKKVRQKLETDIAAALVLHINDDGVVTLSPTIQHYDDIEPLLAFLLRQGVRQQDIQLVGSYYSGIGQIARLLARGLDHTRLTFGADVAEKDAALQRYFVATRSYQSLLRNDRHIIVGPKGIGKTALLKKLNTDQDNSIVITPEYYATDLLTTLSSAPFATDLAALTITWKYTLIIEVLRQIVRQNLGDAKTVRAIRDYLVRHELYHSDLSLFDQFIAYLRRITRVKGKVGPVEGELGLESGSELSRLFKMDELLELLPLLQRALRRQVLTIYIDELDQGWNNSDMANRFLIALLTAAIQLRGYSDNLHVVVFLRVEIFELLKPHLPQLDKLRSDIEVLKWSSGDLMRLIARRAMHALWVFTDTDAAAIVRVLFPGHIDPGVVPSFDYLLSRTSYRPREVIQFANLAVELAAQKGSTAVTAEAILRAEEQFSVWKLEHIVAANMYIYPTLSQLLELFRGKTRQWIRRDLEGALSDVLLEGANQQPVPEWCNADLDPNQTIRLLYELEVLGAERYESSGARYPWEGYDFVFDRPKARPELSATFIVHPGLWRALELSS